MRPKIVFMVVVSFLVFTESTFASDVVDLAATLIGRPYVWGAEGPDAFDCSGLTQYVFQEFDVDLPRRAVSQSRIGDPTGRQMERGDLVFFSSDTRRSVVTHVGIYEGAGSMIEASRRYGRVRRSNLEDAYWVERFMFARHVLSEAPGPGRFPTTRNGDVRKVAVRALEQFARILLSRPRR